MSDEGTDTWNKTGRLFCFIRKHDARTGAKARDSVNRDPSITSLWGNHTLKCRCRRRFLEQVTARAKPASHFESSGTSSIDAIHPLRVAMSPARPWLSCDLTYGPLKAPYKQAMTRRPSCPLGTIDHHHGWQLAGDANS